MTGSTGRRGRTRRHQPRARGIALLFSLLALAALALASVALVRSVGTNSAAMGNLGFKMDATASSDRGTELAIGWLVGNVAGSGVDADVAAAGYYATSLDSLDPTGRRVAATPRTVVDWDGNGCAGVSGAFSACIGARPAVTLGANTVSYVITRLCATAGDKDAAGNSCAFPLSNGQGDDSNSNAADYASPKGFGALVTSPYFRVIVRSVGGRNSVSITETLVHF